MNLINKNFNNLGFPISAEIILDAVCVYEKTTNNLYSTYNKNEKEYGHSGRRTDYKNIDVSDQMAKIVAKKIGWEINANNKHPDIVPFHGADEILGIESKATWVRATTKCIKSVTTDQKYKQYGQGIENPYYYIPKKIRIGWSAHSAKECNLLAFAWDFLKDGNIKIVGGWFACLGSSDWGKLGKSTTPVVRTSKLVHDKFKVNWIFVDSEYKNSLTEFVSE